MPGIEYTQLSDEDRRKVILKGKNWYNGHSRLVDGLMQNSRGNSVAPSGSDLDYPELWKAIHWNWFFDELYEEL